MSETLPAPDITTPPPDQPAEPASRRKSRLGVAVHQLFCLIHTPFGEYYVQIRPLGVTARERQANIFRRDLDRIE